MHLFPIHSPNQTYLLSFNSLCLGFFHASFKIHREEKSGSKLSIPFAWDFSMHQQRIGQRNDSGTRYFQFPLLGIFPCICSPYTHQIKLIYCLSIPFAWDFSMHPSKSTAKKKVAVNFQFPLLGIFPCISSVLVNAMTAVQDTFNSLCLGFFHASVPHTLTKSNLFTVFQFPLLGIFPCILQNPPRRKNPQSPFNSLCL